MEIMDNNYAERLDAIAVDSHTNAINNNLTNSCETFLLFHSNCCNVISSDTINFITSKYLINESSEKKQMMSTIIESFFKLHVEETKNIIDEEILSVINTIGNEQINYDNVLKNYYGEWKEFVQGGAFHTNIFYDTHNSYKKYIRPKGDK